MARSFRYATVVLVTVSILAACGSDGPSGTSTTTGGSEYTIVPAAEVTAGLLAVQALGEGLADVAVSDEAAGQDRVERMYTKWYEFEGTVKTEARDLYIQMEDGLAGMKVGAEDGDRKRVTKGLAAFIAGAEAYRAAHP